ncbi:MAG: hypothetical protein AB7S75_10010 [Desulfococcaceae bacterium]
MQIKAISTWLICVAIVLLVCWLFFKTIDMSVTIDHQEQHAKVILKQRNLLVHVLNTTSINEPESKVRELLKQFAGDSFFQKGSGEVVAEQVSFFFKDGKFIRVDVGDDTK